MRGSKLRDAVDLVAEELDADGFVVEIGRLDLHDVAAHAETAAVEGDVVALVEHVHQLGEDGLAADLLPAFHGEQHVHVILGRAQAVDAGDAGDDDDIAAGEQGAGGGEAEALDLLIDGGILLDVGVACAGCRPPAGSNRSS